MNFKIRATPVFYVFLSRNFSFIISKEALFLIVQDQNIEIAFSKFVRFATKELRLLRLWKISEERIYLKNAICNR